MLIQAEWRREHIANPGRVEKRAFCLSRLSGEESILPIQAEWRRVHIANPGRVEKRAYCQSRQSGEESI